MNFVVVGRGTRDLGPVWLVTSACHITVMAALEVRRQNSSQDFWCENLMQETTNKLEKFVACQSYGYEPNASPIESTHQTLGVVSSDYVPNIPFISPNTGSWSVEDEFVVGTYSTSSVRSRCMSIMGSIRVSTRRFGGVTWREIRERAVVRCATFQ